MITEWTERARDIRATLTAKLTRAPGRGRDWEAEAGAFRATASTEKAAADALAAQAGAFLAVYRPPAVITYAGHTAVVALAAGCERDAWEITTVRPNGTAMHMTVAASGWDEAEAHGRWTLAHMATDSHDDASVHAGAAFLAGCERFGYGQYGPETIYRDAAWQRAARHAIDAGMGDAFHQWATDHAADFAVPAPDAEAPAAPFVSDWTN